MPSGTTCSTATARCSAHAGTSDWPVPTSSDALTSRPLLPCSDAVTNVLASLSRPGQLVFVARMHAPTATGRGAANSRALCVCRAPQRRRACALRVPNRCRLHQHLWLRCGERALVQASRDARLRRRLRRQRRRAAAVRSEPVCLLRTRWQATAALHRARLARRSLSHSPPLNLSLSSSASAST